MNTICTDRQAIEEFMKENLKESRYIHSLGVEKMASELAGIYGADIEKAAFAGRYHDIAKCFTPEVMNRYVREFGLSSIYIDNNALAHSKVAAGILSTRFGVEDEEVLNAVKSHTTGREGMSLLEEIVYVADAIEYNRNYEGIEELRDLARTDLDAACLFIMDFTIDRIRSQGRVLDEDTVRAREFINNRIAARNN
ncbi:MAG: bis(5'-nucleosyl)-tetraphosphatase (symmetrical) YqeK [Mogibacterium sp.]|nr:bis(5'-nucleosyl)-tetraphosphatase (symmetrical) YqeK [Mogibacterium sp.]